MKDDKSEQQAEAIIKALNEAIEQGPWSESNFLRAIGKKLTDIRERFIQQVKGPGQEQVRKETQVANQKAQRTEQQLIFVALYSYDGANPQSWERILMNLPKQMISRPIYASEGDVKEIIKTKENKNNEAYVSLYIDQSDILLVSADKTPIDKLGKPLLVLKDKSLSVDNYNLFVHVSGTYKYTQGRLVKYSPDEKQ